MGNSNVLFAKMMDPSFSPGIAIRRATPEDCFLLSRLGQKAYRQHFTYLWTPEGLDQFFQLAYTPNFFRTVLLDDNAIVWLAEKNNQGVGYLMYYRSRRLPGEVAAGGYINRIYLIKEANGLGLGSQLMTFALEQARHDHKAYVWLESMQSSERAITFYQKHGFQICGATTFTKIKMREPDLAKMWYLRYDP